MTAGVGIEGGDAYEPVNAAFRLKKAIGKGPVELQGGALDTIKPGVTGLLFEEQTVHALKAAIEQFESMIFDSQTIIKHAESFDETVFIDKIHAFVATHKS